MSWLATCNSSWNWSSKFFVHLFGLSFCCWIMSYYEHNTLGRRKTLYFVSSYKFFSLSWKSPLMPKRFLWCFQFILFPLIYVLPYIFETTVKSKTMTICSCFLLRVSNLNRCWGSSSVFARTMVYSFLVMSFSSLRTSNAGPVTKQKGAFLWFHLLFFEKA